MIDWKRQCVFLEYLNKICGIYSGVLNLQYKILEQYGDADDTQFCALWAELVRKQKNNENLFFFEAGTNIYLWYLFLENRYYVFGPVCTNQVTLEQIHQFAHKYNLKQDRMNLPKFSFIQLLEVVSFSNFGITGDVLGNEKIWRYTKQITKENNKEKTEYDLYRLKEEKQRKSYESERNWYDSIKNGTCENNKSTDEMTGIGSLSKNSDFKQVEYMMVSAITLATRAAIEGGVPPMVAYETSDLLLQQLSLQKNISGIMNNSVSYIDIFTDLVCRYQKQKKAGTLVELCKEYISKYLYKSFTIQQMADDLAVNRSHMSRKFSNQTGMPLKAYIRKKRLQAAENLLKYSEESLSQISEYMQFSSPSRFSAYFKEEYGITPLRYREENKLIEFKENKSQNG